MPVTSKTQQIGSRTDRGCQQNGRTTSGRTTSGRTTSGRTTPRSGRTTGGILLGGLLLGELRNSGRTAPGRDTFGRSLSGRTGRPTSGRPKTTIELETRSELGKPKQNNKRCFQPVGSYTTNMNRNHIKMRPFHTPSSQADRGANKFACRPGGLLATLMTMHLSPRTWWRITRRVLVCSLAKVRSRSMVVKLSGGIRQNENSLN